MLSMSTASLLGLLACALPSSASAADTVTKNFTSVADTYVSVSTTGSESTTPHGEDTTIRTRYGANASSQRLGYVRFDLASLPVTQIESANVTFTYTNLTNADGSSADITVFALASSYVPTPGKLGFDWDEDEMVNGNAPWAASGSSTIPSFVTTIGSFSVSVSPKPTAGASYSLTGSALTTLRNFINESIAAGNTDITFILRSSGGTMFYFATKEHATASYWPTLSVTYTTGSIPEPGMWAAFAGIAMLIAGFILKRRR